MSFPGCLPVFRFDTPSNQTPQPPQATPWPTNPPMETRHPQPSSARSNNAPAPAPAPAPPTIENPNIPHGAEPQPSKISTPKPETTTTTTTKSKPKNGKRGRQLNELELVALFRCCIDRRRQLFEAGQIRRGFWISVSSAMESTIGRSYAWQSCRRQVMDRTLKRRIYLDQLRDVPGPGLENESRTKLTATIDNWIVVEDQVRLYNQQMGEKRKLVREDELREMTYQDVLSERLGGSTTTTGTKRLKDPSATAGVGEGSKVSETVLDDMSDSGEDCSPEPHDAEGQREEELTGALLRLAGSITAETQHDKQERQVNKDIEDLKSAVGQIQASQRELVGKLDLLLQLQTRKE